MCKGCPLHEYTSDARHCKPVLYRKTKSQLNDMLQFDFYDYQAQNEVPVGIVNESTRREQGRQRVRDLLIECLAANLWLRTCSLVCPSIPISQAKLSFLQIGRLLVRSLEGSSCEYYCRSTPKSYNGFITNGQACMEEYSHLVQLTGVGVIPPNYPELYPGQQVPRSVKTWQSCAKSLTWPVYPCQRGLVGPAPGSRECSIHRSIV
mmetsp:Transcript_9307/g.17589  ORF Transcript_9307/g.17589 Transcript_9307/m.17589 type:complete len:206 (+) Transcript_9307:221-838(+)